MSLRIVPVTFKDACGFVADHHRHHRPPVGHIFSLGVADDNDVLRGVAMVGRPVARFLDDGKTLEVRGHEFSPENTYIQVRGNGRMRICRACGALRKRERYARLMRLREPKAAD